MKTLRKISKAIWLWLIPLLNCFDFLLMKTPMFLYWFFACQPFIYRTDFYAKYYLFFDKIDSFLVFSLVLHSLFLGRITAYTQTSKIYCLTIGLIIILQYQKVFFNISDLHYFKLYIAILILGMVTIFINAFLNRNENN